MLSGSHDGSVLVWDTYENPRSPAAEEDDDTEPFLHPILPYKAHEDTVNGIRCVSLGPAHTGRVMRRSAENGYLLH